MYIFKNACKNLIRNKGRNLIILFITFLILTSVTLSFSIQSISDLMIARYKEEFGIKATIDFDWEKLERDFPPITIENEDGSITQESSYDLPEISMEDYLKYADSEYVKQVFLSATCNFASDTLEKVPDNLHPDEEFVDLNGMTLDELKHFFDVSTEEEVAEELGGEDVMQEVLDCKRNLVGILCGYANYDDISLLDDFSGGECKLEEGSFPAKNSECIVSTTYAEHNHLKIGDTMLISGPSTSMDTDKISLTIVGMYGAHSSAANATPLGDAYGYVYTMFDTIKDSKFHWVHVCNAIYELKDTESVIMFQKELYEKGLNPYRILSYSSSEYEEHTEPLKKISHIAKVFTICISISGAILLILISLIQIRERKYEIGVLRSMGMSKASVAKGLIYETLFIMLIGFSFSVLLSVVLTKPIASALLGTMTDVQLIALPHAAVIFSAVMAFGLGILSGVCAVFAVTRHEPMKILLERS